MAAKNPFPRYIGRRNLRGRALSWVYQTHKLTFPHFVNNTTNNVTDNLVNEWIFNRGSGNTIFDHGRGVQEDLVIQDLDQVSWEEDSLGLSSGARLLCSPPGVNTTLKVYDMCKVSGELTIEVWFKPANVTQDGPARIITLAPSSSEDSSNHNFMLGQGQHGTFNKAVGSARIKTDLDMPAGKPTVVTEDDSVAAGVIQHMCVTAKPNDDDPLVMTIQTYLSGEANGNPELRDWDDDAGLSFFDDIWVSNFIIAVGNSTVTERPWTGNLYAIRIYDRALTADEIFNNYGVGKRADGARPLPSVSFPTSAVTVNALDGKASLSPYVAGVRNTSTEVGFSVTSPSLVEGVDFEISPSDHTLSYAKEKEAKPIKATLLNPSSLTDTSTITVVLSSITTGSVVAPASGVYTFESGQVYPSSVGLNVSSRNIPPGQNLSAITIQVRSSSPYYLPISATIELSGRSDNVEQYSLSSSIGTGSSIDVLIPASSTRGFMKLTSPRTGFYQTDSGILSALSSTD